MGIGSREGGRITLQGISALRMATILAICSSTQADSWVHTGLSLQDKWLDS